MVYVSCLAKRLVLGLSHVPTPVVQYFIANHKLYPLKCHASRWIDGGYRTVLLLTTVGLAFSLLYHSTAPIDTCPGPAFLTTMLARLFHGMDLTTAFNFLPITFNQLLHPAPSTLRDLSLAVNVVFFAGIIWLLIDTPIILYAVYGIYMAIYSVILCAIYFMGEGLGLSWNSLRRNRTWSLVVIVGAPVTAVGFFTDSDYWIWHAIWHLSALFILYVVFTRVWDVVERNEAVAKAKDHVYSFTHLKPINYASEDSNSRESHL